MEGLEHRSFRITPIDHGVHRVDDAWVFQYEQAGQVALFTVVTEAPCNVARGLPRYRALLPNAFKTGDASEESLRWRTVAARTMADHLRNDQAWPPEAIDLEDLESFDGHRPSRLFW